jgi:transposase-like protein
MNEKANYYTDDFKKDVVKEVLLGHLTKKEAILRYGIRGNSLILNWIRKFELSEHQSMEKKHKLKLDAFARLEAENKRLCEELELERLRVLSLNVMIDLSEEQLKVPIRKNLVPNS